jgi:hypothetical protein
MNDLYSFSVAFLALTVVMGYILSELKKIRKNIDKVIDKRNKT